MSEIDRKALAVVNRLGRLCRHSEAGFRVAAASVQNRGLKTFLKAYAQQRAQFAEVLEATVLQHGGRLRQSRNFLAVMHRGWIVIKTALTLGVQNTEWVALTECYRGESYALKQYAKAIRKNLPPDVMAIVTPQYEAIQEVAGRVSEMVGNQNGRLVVRLFDGDEDANRAMRRLQRAGFESESISTVPFDENIMLYDENVTRHTLQETAMAGGIGGAIVGSLIGLVIGTSLVVIPGSETLFAGGVMGVAATIILAGAVAGALLGLLLGSLMGWGVSEEDSYLYDDSFEKGEVLMMVRTDNEHASEASGIMRQVNLAKGH